jgi:hypothetical protein
MLYSQTGHLLSAGSRRLDMRFGNSEHIELNAGTTSTGFRLDFYRAFEEQFATSDSVILGGELGRFLNKENEGVITVIDDKVGVSKNWEHSNAIVILEHENNAHGRSFKWHDKVRLLHVGSGNYFQGLCVQQCCQISNVFFLFCFFFCCCRC